MSAEKNFMENVMNIFNETETTTNAMTLGLGFHDFRGKNATTKEVIEQIGANFNVEEQKLVRHQDGRPHPAISRSQSDGFLPSPWQEMTKPQILFGATRSVYIRRLRSYRTPQRS